MDFFPIFLDIRSQPVLVVGGGSVAARKVTLLQKAGAEVTLIATVLLKGDFDDPRLLYVMRPPM